MPYPSRPRRRPLPKWRGTRNRLRGQRLIELKEFVVAQYLAGLSLREIAELTDRAWSDVRAILDSEGVPRRPPGAVRLHRRNAT